MNHSFKGVLYDAVTGVVGIASVRVDGLLEVVSATAVESVDGFLDPMEDSSSKSALAEIDGGWREHHQTQKTRQHEYTITGLRQL